LLSTLSATPAKKLCTDNAIASTTPEKKLTSYVDKCEEYLINGCDSSSCVSRGSLHYYFCVATCDKYISANLSNVSVNKKPTAPKKKANGKPANTPYSGNGFFPQSTASASK